MRAGDAYAWLMARTGEGAGDPFDRHVVACILSLAWDEAVADGGGLPEGLGLDGDAVAGLITRLFPDAFPTLAPLVPGPVVLGDDEMAVRDLLWMYADGGSWLQRLLSAMIARRCTRPNHLWQDLGLRNRGELSQLMSRHFGLLAARNNQDMKWKKYLYRTICRAEGFSLCTAPVCNDCEDFDNCFGAEEGEAVLAHIRSDRSRATA